MFAGVTALLAACCFAELCLEFPVSGGAFSYVMATFGELPSCLTLGGLLMQYVVGMVRAGRRRAASCRAALCRAALCRAVHVVGLPARPATHRPPASPPACLPAPPARQAAVARGFSKYLARLCNADPDLFVVEVGDDKDTIFDFMVGGRRAAGAHVGANWPRALACRRGRTGGIGMPGVAAGALRSARGCAPCALAGADPSPCGRPPPPRAQAAGIVLLMSLLLSIGVRESAFAITSERRCWHRRRRCATRDPLR